MRWAVLAIAGAVLCTVGDHLHATQGVLVYRHVVAWDQDGWVPLLFAAASIVTVLGARPFVAWGRRVEQAAPPDARLIAADGLGFFLAYTYTAFAPHDRPDVTLAVLGGAFLVRVLGERRPAWLVVYCLVLGVGGVLTEAAIAATGAFRYLHPDLLGTPRWLAGIYWHAGLLSGGLASSLFAARSGAFSRAAP